MNDINYVFEVHFRKEWNEMLKLFNNAKGLDRIFISTKETQYSKKSGTRK